MTIVVHQEWEDELCGVKIMWESLRNMVPEWKPSRWPGGTKDLVDGQKKALRCCFTSSHPDVLRGKDRVSERERRERERVYNLERPLWLVFPCILGCLCLQCHYLVTHIQCIIEDAWLLLPVCLPKPIMLESSKYTAVTSCPSEI